MTLPQQLEADIRDPAFFLLDKNQYVPVFWHFYNLLYHGYPTIYSWTSS